MSDSDAIMFPDEPIGGEAAIIWHLEQIERHEWQASQAEACDMIEVCYFYDNQIKKHQTRLKTLEDRFPETAKSARAYMDARAPRPNIDE